MYKSALYILSLVKMATTRGQIRMRAIKDETGENFSCAMRRHDDREKDIWIQKIYSFYTSSST